MSEENENKPKPLTMKQLDERLKKVEKIFEAFENPKGVISMPLEETLFNSDFYIYLKLIEIDATAFQRLGGDQFELTAKNIRRGIEGYNKKYHREELEAIKLLKEKKEAKPTMTQQEKMNELEKNKVK